MKPKIEHSQRANAFRFDATLEAWVAYKEGYADALLDIPGRETSKDGIDDFAENMWASAHIAGRERLDECAAVLLDDAPGENLEAPFCGCETCVVREILSAAYPFLEKHFEQKISNRLGFAIDWGSAE